MAKIYKYILLILKNITLIIANSDSCIQESQRFIRARAITNLDFTDFAFDNLDKVRDFLSGLGTINIEHLSSEFLCEKGCSLHVTCKAFKYTPETGCEIWTTEIEPSEQIRSVLDLERIRISAREFRNYVTGKFSINCVSIYHNLFAIKNVKL